MRAETGERGIEFLTCMGPSGTPCDPTPAEDGLAGKLQGLIVSGGLLRIPEW